MAAAVLACFAWSIRQQQRHRHRWRHRTPPYLGSCPARHTWGWIASHSQPVLNHPWECNMCARAGGSRLAGWAGSYDGVTCMAARCCCFAASQLPPQPGTAASQLPLYGTAHAMSTLPTQCTCLTRWPQVWRQECIEGAFWGWQHHRAKSPSSALVVLLHGHSQGSRAPVPGCGAGSEQKTSMHCGLAGMPCISCQGR